MKRYPMDSELSVPWDGAYIHNLSSYTVYIHFNKEAAGTDDDIPLPPSAWRDFGFVITKYVSCYCASDASATGADVVLLGYSEQVFDENIIQKAVAVAERRAPTPAERRRAEREGKGKYERGEMPAYLKREEY